MVMGQTVECAQLIDGHIKTACNLGKGIAAADQIGIAVLSRFLHLKYNGCSLLIIHLLNFINGGRGGLRRRVTHRIEKQGPSDLDGRAVQVIPVLNFCDGYILLPRDGKKGLSLTHMMRHPVLTSRRSHPQPLARLQIVTGETIPLPEFRYGDIVIPRDAEKGLPLSDRMVIGALVL